MGLERSRQSPAATELRIPAASNYDIIASCTTTKVDTERDTKRYTKSYVCQGRLRPAYSSVPELLRCTSTPPRRADFQPLLILSISRDISRYYSAIITCRSRKASLRSRTPPTALGKFCGFAPVLKSFRWYVSYRARRSHECKEGKSAGLLADGLSSYQWDGHDPAWILRLCLYSNVMIPKKRRREFSQSVLTVLFSVQCDSQAKGQDHTTGETD